MNGYRDNWGLVLSGGGGKGAYEIGVWKALNEYNSIPICGVSGTSVGALNAALYTSLDYDTAEKIWLNISNDKILTSKAFSDAGKSEEFFKSILPILLKWVNSDDKPEQDLPSALRDYFGMYYEAGMFSRSGLSEIIKESNVLENISKKSLPCFAACFNKSKLCTEYFRLNNLSSLKAEKVLLASSAIPFIFGEENIDGYRYCDGGVWDNTPIKPLYDLGIRSFLVIHLNNRPTPTQDFTNSRFIHVYPKENLGNFIDGTLDFDADNSKKRLLAGYEDMKKILDEINEYGIDYAAKKYAEAVNPNTEDSSEFVANIKSRFNSDRTKEFSSQTKENAQYIFEGLSNKINRIQDEIDTLFKK